MIDFLERHFGDSVGLYIIHLGVALIVAAAFVPGVNAAAMATIQDTGKGLVGAGLIALKLKAQSSNGNSGKPAEPPKEPPK